jgi:hypothetical protein
LERCKTARARCRQSRCALPVCDGCHSELRGLCPLCDRTILHARVFCRACSGTYLLRDSGYPCAACKRNVVCRDCHAHCGHCGECERCEH